MSSKIVEILVETVDVMCRSDAFESIPTCDGQFELFA